MTRSSTCIVPHPRESQKRAQRQRASKRTAGRARTPRGLAFHPFLTISVLAMLASRTIKMYVDLFS